MSVHKKILFHYYFITHFLHQCPLNELTIQQGCSPHLSLQNKHWNQSWTQSCTHHWRDEWANCHQNCCCCHQLCIHEHIIYLHACGLWYSQNSLSVPDGPDMVGGTTTKNINVHACTKLKYSQNSRSSEKKSLATKKLLIDAHG